MGRVLVVSRDPQVSEGLAPTDHDLVDITPDVFEAWVDGTADGGLDGVVLAVGDPDAALSAITELRARARMVPVLVVPGDDPAWDDPRMRDLPAATMLPRPVTSATLAHAVTRLVEEGTSSFLSSTLPRPDGADLPADPLLLRRPRDEDADHANDAVSLTHSSTLPYDDVLAGDFDLPPVPATTARGDRDRTTAELVRDVQGVAHELYGVTETAEAVIGDALERVHAEAAALLLPDGLRWRVAAGVGLRTVERRAELTADDWLVSQVVRGRRAVIMEDTDIVRQPLRGAPLASRHHLLATPVPEVDGLLLVARDSEPGFGAGDVESLSTLAAEAAPLIANSLAVRALARRLDGFRDSS